MLIDAIDDTADDGVVVIAGRRYLTRKNYPAGSPSTNAKPVRRR